MGLLSGFDAIVEEENYYVYYSHDGRQMIVPKARGEKR